MPYLTGGISIAVLAVGSTAPGLLEFAIGKFSSIFPDYRERVLRHEAAHFLCALFLPPPSVSVAWCRMLELACSRSALTKSAVLKKAKKSASMHL